jgi:dTDP-4-dehydrorhamnose reductase
MKIVITGANGMLGSSLCRQYHNEHEVHAFHRDKRCYTNSFENYSLDLLDFNQVQALFNQINPDIVIHCAGLTSVDRCEIEPELAVATNVTVSENIAKACCDKIKLIYISSDQVYGETEFHSETNELLQPLNQYGKTKLLGERKIQELCTGYLILRTNIFWYNVKLGRISSAEWIYKTIKNQEGIRLFSDYTFSPISTVCLGNMIFQLLVADFSGIINVGSSAPCSKYEFGLQLAKEFDFDPSFIKIGLMSDHSFSAIRSNKLDLNVSKLIKLGITPPDLSHSMKIFSEYYKVYTTLVNK